MDVPRETWPVYYGVNPSELPLDAIREQCLALRAGFFKPLRWYEKQLRRRGSEMEFAAAWFPMIHGWLASGQIFVILE